MNSSTQKPIAMNMDRDSKENIEKVLGLWWNITTDSLIYSLKYNKGNKEVLKGNRRPTKREILLILLSIYDPLGLMSNFLVYSKILLQDIWRSRVDWDDQITNELFETWFLWLKYLPDVEKLSIPRCYLNNFTSWENNIFVDSSENVSAMAADLRICDEDEVIQCALVDAKTHVAPLKLQTMPRLELDGALMGARFARKFKNTFP